MQVGKCVVIGDEKIGKNELCYALTSSEFFDEGQYVPTFFYDCDKTIKVDDQEINLLFVSAEGFENYKGLFHDICLHVDVFICCFSVISPDTFQNVRNSWFPELSILYPKVPIVLVGTNNHLRERMKDTISIDEGIQLAHDIGAVKYIEFCKEETEEILKETARAAINFKLRPLTLLQLLFDIVFSK